MTLMPPKLELTAQTAYEMVQLGLGCLIDIRQPFELEIKGVLPSALNVPFFNVKQFFGIQLTPDEQEALDSDLPNDLDIRAFIKALNTLKHEKNCTLLILCNSGRRSLAATQLLRELGYVQTFSVQGGFISYKNLVLQ